MAEFGRKHAASSAGPAFRIRMTRERGAAFPPRPEVRGLHAAIPISTRYASAFNG